MIGWRQDIENMILCARLFLVVISRIFQSQYLNAQSLPISDPCVFDITQCVDCIDTNWLYWVADRVITNETRLDILPYVSAAVIAK